MKDFLQVQAEKVFLARSQKYIHDKYRVITTQRIKIAKRRRFFLFYFYFSYFCCYTFFPLLPPPCLCVSGYSGHGLASSFNVCPAETCFMSLKYTLGCVCLLYISLRLGTNRSSFVSRSFFQTRLRRTLRVSFFGRSPLDGPFGSGPSPFSPLRLSALV